MEDWDEAHRWEPCTAGPGCCCLHHSLSGSHRMRPHSCLQRVPADAKLSLPAASSYFKAVFFSCFWLCVISAWWPATQIPVGAHGSVPCELWGVEERHWGRAAAPSLALVLLLQQCCHIFCFLGWLQSCARDVPWAWAGGEVWEGTGTFPCAPGPVSHSLSSGLTLQHPLSPQRWTFAICEVWLRNGALKLRPHPRGACREDLMAPGSPAVSQNEPCCEFIVRLSKESEGVSLLQVPQVEPEGFFSFLCELCASSFLSPRGDILGCECPCLGAWAGVLGNLGSDPYLCPVPNPTVDGQVPVLFPPRVSPLRQPLGQGRDEGVGWEACSDRVCDGRCVTEGV